MRQEVRFQTGDVNLSVYWLEMVFWRYLSPLIWELMICKGSLASKDLGGIKRL